MRYSTGTARDNLSGVLAQDAAKGRENWGFPRHEAGWEEMSEQYRRARNNPNSFNEARTLFDDHYYGPVQTPGKDYGLGRRAAPSHHDVFFPNMGPESPYSRPIPISQRTPPSEKGDYGIMGNTPPSGDKRFKSLPDAEVLPRNEILGGYIFVCNNDTMEENLKRQLFGLPQRYRDSVRAIQPGLPLFLYNYSTHQLHGVFEATSFGGTNIDASAWEDKKTPGESRFPAQVRARVRKRYKALDEVLFRPLLHHYDGPKFRLQLSVPEVLALLDLFVQRDGPESPSIDESPIGSMDTPESPFKFEQL